MTPPQDKVPWKVARKNLFDFATKYPNAIEDVIDSAYLAGLEDREDKANYVQRADEMVPEMVTTTATAIQKKDQRIVQCDKCGTMKNIQEGYICTRCKEKVSLHSSPESTQSGEFVTWQEKEREEHILELVTLASGIFDNDFMINAEGENKFMDFFISRLEAHRQEAVESYQKRLLEKLPAKFWEDEDHSVGGYISKKDLKSFFKIQNLISDTTLQ